MPRRVKVRCILDSQTELRRNEMHRRKVLKPAQTIAGVIATAGLNPHLMPAVGTGQLANDHM